MAETNFNDLWIDTTQKMPDEKFHRIEVKAAYAQCIMMKHLAENLAKMKEKRNLVLSLQRK